MLAVLKRIFNCIRRKQVKNVILIICISVFLIGCGGSSSDPKTSTANIPVTPNNSEENTQVGVFIDAPVKGLAYSSAPSGKKGTTNEKGEFEYIDGDTVSFNMGSIELGKATPDKANKVKATQLDQALLVAQLLQVLDNDVSDERIDVSDIVIPVAVKQSIIERLQDKDGDANTADIITEDQLVSIKKVNPKKLTLQQKVKVVSKDKVLAHIKQQMGKSGLRFSASELKNLFLIESSLLSKFDGIATGFSTANSPATWIDIKNHSNKKMISAEMSKQQWEIDSKGNLVQHFEDFKCVFSKITEDIDLIDISYFCSAEDDAKDGPQGLTRLVKPQPLSANDLSGKSFNFKGLGGNEETLIFRNDGTLNLNCNDEKSLCSYKDHPSYKNTIWIKGGGDSGEKDALMILAQGSLAKGKFVIIHFKDGGNTLDSVELIKVSGNTLEQEFESADNDERNDHNNNAINSISVAISSPQDDIKNTDNDLQTDRFLLIAWASLTNKWPNIPLPTVLVELTFDIVSGSTETGSSPINIMSTSNATGFAFDGQDYLVALDKTSNLATPSLASNTQSVYVSSYRKSIDGTKAVVQISYNSDDSTTTGLGLRIHYDNRVLQLSDVTNVLEAELFVRPKATSRAEGNALGFGMPEGFTPPPKDAVVTDALVDYYNPSTGETWQSSTGGYGLAPGWIRGTKEDYERNKEYFDSLIQGT